MASPTPWAVVLLLQTETISSKVLALQADDRRVLLALLKWSPYVSRKICAALEAVASPWMQKCAEEDYLLILYDLEQSIQQAPIIWSNVAQINIRLVNLYARLQQAL
ncbi:hypothetical protein CPC08DRAFT_771834 [Agrocybe pediades]|nr:hypothetical protein CPC08DRAFT_771834 [Agrocybe pediades]